MRALLFAGVALVMFQSCPAAEVKTHSLLASPNGRIDVALSIDAHGQPRVGSAEQKEPRRAQRYARHLYL